MNLKYHYEIQDGLVAHIQKNHPISIAETKYDRIDKKFLATMVELAEAANDSRVFKFWSKNQLPKDTMPEEVSDFHHFFLELGIEFGYRLEELPEAFKLHSPTAQFLSLFKTLGRLHTRWSNEDYEHLGALFNGLLEWLEITHEELDKEYLAKNLENHNRQLNGY
ncbi:dUTP diphosphatase [Priestia megaterium]|uniref:dUTP diphosphatase n=1 Tax=Priestia megaterium TaxID=1404 RepID=UPI002E1BD089|nr:dUTP diphosphatase [Priestia megaterium]